MARQMVRIKAEKVIKEDDASVVLRLRWQDEVKDETLPKGVIRRHSELEFDVETWFLDLFKLRKYHWHWRDNYSKAPGKEKRHASKTGNKDKRNTTNGNAVLSAGLQKPLL